MQIFFLTLRQMLTMFTFIAAGYVIRRANILPKCSDTVLSKLEMYIFLPALNLSTWMTKCTLDTLRDNYTLIIYGLLLMGVSMLAAYPLSRIFVRGQSKEQIYQRNIYKYAMTFGNYGFMGNFIVLGVWGTDMFFKYSMFTFFVNLLCSSWGLYVLIPKGEQGGNAISNAVKRMLTPPIIALVLGVFAGLLNLTHYVPEFFMTVLSDASGCMGPVAMILAGFVVGGYDFKRLLTNKKVYLATFLRLIIIPSALVLLLRLMGANKEIMTLALIAFATPLGLNTIVYPAAYGGETSTGASMTMISHTLSVITIPLMYLFLIVWL